MIPPHVTEGTAPCWCGPLVAFGRDPDDGVAWAVVIHDDPLGLQHAISLDGSPPA